MDIAIVSGASSELGCALSRKLLELGFRVYGLGGDYRNMPFSNVDFIPVSCDLGDARQVAEKVEGILEKEGGVYLIVNNAKAFPAESFAETGVGQIQRCINVNLVCPVVMVRTALASLQKMKGMVVNIGSSSAETSKGGIAGATASGGLRWMGEALFHELRDMGVRVSTIVPEPNRIARSVLESRMKRDERPGRLDAKEVANALGFIVSNHSSTVPTEIVIRPQHVVERDIPPVREIPYPEPQPIPYTVPREEIEAEERLDLEQDERDEEERRSRKKRRRRRRRRGDKGEDQDGEDQEEDSDDAPEESQEPRERDQKDDRNQRGKDRGGDRPERRNDRREDRDQQGRRDDRRDDRRKDHREDRRDDRRADDRDRKRDEQQPLKPSPKPESRPAAQQAGDTESAQEEKSGGRRRRRRRRPKPAVIEDAERFGKRPQPVGAQPPVERKPEEKKAAKPSEPERREQPKTEAKQSAEAEKKASAAAEPVKKKSATRKRAAKKAARKQAKPAGSETSADAGSDSSDAKPAKKAARKTPAKKAARKAAKKATKKAAKKAARKSAGDSDGNSDSES